ncbi:glycoside hydrolase family 97 protein [Parabacteroides sp. PF5-6]|uniref:glycoside hydrolase family 97 protein n=1 Tax=Parabacteroides sp. PF5-6 TaxID=1742403 RepID=UPI0024074E0B|nr:glycoside hydrolase family 97 protein [Parabacteroides sp. PF5-6]MDF9830339.1 hypothetical protein [Parabacteroides sp. PF5-6]
MKKGFIYLILVLLALPLRGQIASVSGPDSYLKLKVNLKAGIPYYSVEYKGKVFLEDSPLGLVTNIGDFSTGLTFVESKAKPVEYSYTQDRIKRSQNHYKANELICTFTNKDGKKIDILFRISNNDIAFKYQLPPYGETACCVIEREATGFDFPQQTTTFLTPQSTPMIGWKRTKPSYEEEYVPDEPIGTPSKYGYGYTFPGLFHIGDEGWVLVSETGVSSLYCGSRLSEGTKDGLYTLSFPDPKENNGIGTATAGLALPGETPWRTLTVGDNLKPIVETTIPFDVVEPLYEPSKAYKFGRGTWSWIMWQDNSINFDDQIKYIDLAAALNWEFVLVDNWWDTNIGRERIPELVKYANAKGVDVCLWYNSNGYWSDAPQGPKQCMSNSVARNKEMKWLQSVGVKGLKVDFFGGDKQETMKLYEDILVDANEYGLTIIFHGCTLPRGWERMYPNYVGSEAVLASENLIFTQHANDNEAYNACLHPFIRNTVGIMEFGPVLLNKRHNRTNDGGTTRVTTDIFQLATAILFQSPVQMFALAPNNLTDVPAFEIDFMRNVPTTWDDICFIDGYPGKYCILARRHQDKWYVAGINAQKEAITLNVNLPMFAGQKVTQYVDDKKREPKMNEISIKANGEVQLVIQPEGGVVLTH